MPSVGLGLWKIKKRRTSQVVQQAIKLDIATWTAQLTMGTGEVGDGINEIYESSRVVRNYGLRQNYGTHITRKNTFKKPVNGP